MDEKIVNIEFNINAKYKTKIKDLMKYRVKRFLDSLLFFGVGIFVFVWQSLTESAVGNPFLQTLLVLCLVFSVCSLLYGLLFLAFGYLNLGYKGTAYFRIYKEDNAYYLKIRDDKTPTYQTLKLNDIGIDKYPFIRIHANNKKFHVPKVQLSENIINDLNLIKEELKKEKSNKNKTTVK